MHVFTFALANAHVHAYIHGYKHTYIRTHMLHVYYVYVRMRVDFEISTRDIH